MNFNWDVSYVMYLEDDYSCGETFDEELDGFSRSNDRKYNLFNNSV